MSLISSAVTGQTEACATLTAFSGKADAVIPCRRMCHIRYRWFSLDRNLQNCSYANGIRDPNKRDHTAARHIQRWPPDI